MKRASIAIFIILMLLQIEAQAQSYSVLTGMVIEIYRGVLVVESDEEGVFRVRVGRRTVYPNHVPVVGDKVRVEYSIIREVYVGYSVTILENMKEEIEPQGKALEKKPPMPSNLPPDISGLVLRKLSTNQGICSFLEKQMLFPEKNRDWNG
jgi:hypothetical protein